MAQHARMSKSLRRLRTGLERRLAAPWLLDALAGAAERYIRRRRAKIAWEAQGVPEIEAALAKGPIILVGWHGRLVMSPYMWDPAWGPVCSLTSKALPGQMVARIQGRFGWQSLPMHDRKKNSGSSLKAARMLRSGTSICIACDGPLGPPRRMKTIPLDWSRLSGAPIWLWTYSVEAAGHLRSWDRMLLPKPRGRGVMLFQPWGGVVPKRADADTLEGLRAKLEADLDALTLEADRAMGHRQIIC